MLISRRVEFSASHICRNPAAFRGGKRAPVRRRGQPPNGHGHNYVLEVTLEGEPHPVTGMVVDLKDVKDILNREVVDPMDHRHLNYEVPPFDKVVPTTENLAVEIWRRLEPQFARHSGAAPHHPVLRDRRSVCGLFRKVADAPCPMCASPGAIGSRASHRLHSAHLSPEENRRVYGKCNNPYGHGHDYVMDVTVRAPWIRPPGWLSASPHWTISSTPWYPTTVRPTQPERGRARVCYGDPTTENLASRHSRSAAGTPRGRWHFRPWPAVRKGQESGRRKEHLRCSGHRRGGMKRKGVVQTMPLPQWQDRCPHARDLARTRRRPVAGRACSARRNASKRR